LDIKSLKYKYKVGDWVEWTSYYSVKSISRILNRTIWTSVPAYTISIGDGEGIIEEFEIIRIPTDSELAYWILTH